MPRPILLRLYETDRQTLLDEIARTFNDEVRRRCQAMLKLADGYGQKEVAAAIKVHPTTLGRWARQFRKHGLKGLLGKKESNRRGRPPKLRREQLELLARTAQTPPRNLGKAFSKWTLQRLAGHFSRECSINIRSHHVGFLLRRMGVTWLHGTNEAPISSFSTTILWFTVAKVRWVDGSRPGNLLVAINLASGDITESWTARKNHIAFIEFLERVLQHQSERRLIVIADSASVRMTKQVTQFLRIQSQRIELAIIPAHFARVEPGVASGTQKDFRFVLNSPGELLARVQHGIRQIELAIGRLKHHFSSN